MALLASYQSFVARPTADALAADASIHYVPTTTSISEPVAIVKHYAAQAQQLVKRNEKVINAFESGDSLCVETETTIEFLLGGGAFLPGLDENFIADHSVTLPVIHIVSFTEQHKIQQIRIYWDQGSLLKGVEVIGRSGHAWPIREGTAQCRVLSQSHESEEERAGRSRFRGGANGDKYKTLNLFQAPEFHPRDETPANPVEPRPTAKPADRDYHDLFAAGADLPPQERSHSPSKSISNPLKSGAGKSYGENRLFEEEDIVSPKKSLATNSKRYDHFEFGEAEFEPRPTTSKSSKHASQWNFEDFVTPSKPPPKVAQHNQRNFGWSDDEEEAAKPPVHLPHKPQPRPDAQTHFDFVDDTPTQEKHRPRSSRHDQDLYVDHVTSNYDDEAPSTERKLPLGNITNQTQHNKTFSSHFDINDGSPSSEKSSKENASKKTEPNLAKVVKTMESSWDLYDNSPEPAKQRGINIAGDGMGSRKAPGEKPWWEFE